MDDISEMRDLIDFRPEEIGHWSWTSADWAEYYITIDKMDREAEQRRLERRRGVGEFCPIWYGCRERFLKEQQLSKEGSDQRRETRAMENADYEGISASRKRKREQDYEERRALGLVLTETELEAMIQ